MIVMVMLFFFFNDTATTEIYTLSLHDALPISLDIIFDAVCYSYRYFLRECEGGYSHFIYSPTLSKSGTEATNFDFGVC